MKNILVAGGTDGLGLEIVKILAQDSLNKILVIGRNDKNIRELNDRISFFAVDITKEKEIESFVQSFQGFLNTLIITVGIFGHGKLDSFSYDQIRLSLETNLLGHIFLTRAMLPKMGLQSRIISINSISGINPTKERSLYCASKWGLRGFYYSLSEELKERQIMVTQIFPNYFDSNYAEKIGITKDKTRAISKKLIADQIVSLCQFPENIFVSEYHIKNITYA